MIKQLFLALILIFGVSTMALASEAVDVNTATVEQLSEALNGVGESKAQAIVDYREANGAFEHIDELVNVRGIGMATVDKNRDVIRLDLSDNE